MTTDIFIILCKYLLYFNKDLIDLDYKHQNFILLFDHINLHQIPPYFWPEIFFFLHILTVSHYMTHKTSCIKYDSQQKKHIYIYILLFFLSKGSINCSISKLNEKKIYEEKVNDYWEKILSL